FSRDWSSDVCSSDLSLAGVPRIATGGASAHGNEIAVSREAEAIGHRNPFVVLPVVALLAEKLQVLEVQRHRRIVDVGWCQVDLDRKSTRLNSSHVKI